MEEDNKGVFATGYYFGKKDFAKKIIKIVDDVDSDSTYLYIKIDKEKIGLPFFKYKKDIFEWVKEKINEV